MSPVSPIFHIVNEINLLLQTEDIDIIFLTETDTKKLKRRKSGASLFGIVRMYSFGNYLTLKARLVPEETAIKTQKFLNILFGRVQIQKWHLSTTFSSFLSHWLSLKLHQQHRPPKVLIELWGGESGDG